MQQELGFHSAVWWEYLPSPFWKKLRLRGPRTSHCEKAKMCKQLFLSPEPQFPHLKSTLNSFLQLVMGVVKAGGMVGERSGVGEWQEQ